MLQGAIAAQQHKPLRVVIQSARGIHAAVGYEVG